MAKEQSRTRRGAEAGKAGRAPKTKPRARPAAPPVEPAATRRRTKRSPGPLDDGEVVSSLRSLAARVDRRYETVREWTLRADWPWARPPACWPLKVSDITAWAATVFVRDPNSGGMPDDRGQSQPGDEIDPLKRLRILKLEQEVEKLRGLNAQLHSRLIDRSDVQQEISGLIANWRAAIIAEAAANIDALDAFGSIVEGRYTSAVDAAVERAENLCRRFAREMTESVRRAQ